MKVQYVITIVFAIVLASLCVAVTASDDTSEAASEVTIYEKTGHWYLVEEAWLDENKEIQRRNIMNDPYIGMDDLDIFAIELGLFYGYYMETNISGSINNNGVAFGLNVDDTEYYAGASVLSNNVMHVTLTTAVVDNGSVVSTSASYLTFTKDRSYIDLNVAITDLTGEWDSFSCVSYDGEETELGEMKLDVVQKENLIYIDLDGDDYIGDLELHGVVSTTSVLSIAPLIDSNGKAWRATYRNDVLTLNTVFDDDPMRDICLKFTDTGEAGVISSSVNLLGSSWRAVSISSMDSNGDTYYLDTQYYLEFDEQSGCNVVGTFYYGLEYSPIYLCLVEGSSILFSIDYDDHVDTLRSGGWVSATQIQLRHTTTHDDGRMVSTTLLFEKTQPILDSNIAGHWYLKSSAGYEFDGTYTEYSPENLTSKYDLDIYGIKDGVLYGYYAGGPVTGSFVGGILTISGEDFVNGGSFFFQGWLKDQNTLAINDVYYREVDGKIETSGYSTVLSRDRSGVVFEDISVDVVGKWIMSNAKAYDGTMREISYTDLVITDYSHDVFKGSYGMMVSGVRETISFTGTVSSMSTADKAYGMIIDSKGSIWYINIDDDTLIMKIADKIELLDDKLASVEVTYILEGSNTSAVVLEIPDIKGTWTATEMYIMTQEGKPDDELVEYVLEITSQDGEFAVGEGTQGGRKHGTFSMAITTNVLSEIAIVMASDYDLGDEYGFGWLTTDDSGKIHMYLVETYQDTADVWTTQLSCFERTG